MEPSTDDWTAGEKVFAVVALNAVMIGLYFLLSWLIRDVMPDEWTTPGVAVMLTCFAVMWVIGRRQDRRRAASANPVLIDRDFERPALPKGRRGDRLQKPRHGRIDILAPGRGDRH